MPDANAPSPAPPFGLFAALRWVKWRYAERDIERAMHRSEISRLHTEIERLENELTRERKYREAANAESLRLSRLCQAMRRAFAKRMGRNKASVEVSTIWTP